MPGIYSIFEAAAGVVGKAPWRWRLLGGAAAGGVGAAAFGDKDRDLMDRITEGVVMGAGTGLAAGGLLKAAGHVADFGGAVGKRVAGKRMAAFGARMASTKAAFTPEMGFFARAKKYAGVVGRSPLMTMAAGAGVGYMVAPEGQKAKGAAIGAGLGLMTPAVVGAYQGFEKLGKVPGGRMGLYLTAAAIPLAAQVAFGHGKPEAAASAVPGIGGTIDYEPLSEDMSDRMTAMNASGDIVLGLNGRRHG